MKSRTSLNINEILLFDIFGSPWMEEGKNIKQICRECIDSVLTYACKTWAVCNVQMFLFLSPQSQELFVCVIGHNLSRSCQDKVCNVLSVLFDYRCKRKAADLCHFLRESVLLD